MISVAYRRQLVDILCPVFTVERRNRNGLNAVAVKTVDVNTDAVRMRARHIVGLDAAVAAKIMARNLAIELVKRQLVLPAQQTKIVLRDQQMQEPTHSTDTAIAVICRDVRFRINLKSNAAAMATAI